MFRGKKYKESVKLFDKTLAYEPAEAFKAMAGMSKAMLSGSGWQYSHGSNKIGTTDTVCFPKSTPDHML